MVPLLNIALSVSTIPNIFFLLTKGEFLIRNGALSEDRIVAVETGVSAIIECQNQFDGELSTFWCKLGLSACCHSRRYYFKSPRMWRVDCKARLRYNPFGIWRGQSSGRFQQVFSNQVLYVTVSQWNGGPGSWQTIQST